VALSGEKYFIHISGGHEPGRHAVSVLLHRVKSYALAAVVEKSPSHERSFITYADITVTYVGVRTIARRKLLSIRCSMIEAVSNLPPSLLKTRLALVVAFLVVVGIALGLHFLFTE